MEQTDRRPRLHAPVIPGVIYGIACGSIMQHAADNVNILRHLSTLLAANYFTKEDLRWDVMFTSTSLDGGCEKECVAAAATRWGVREVRRISEVTCTERGGECRAEHTLYTEYALYTAA